MFHYNAQYLTFSHKTYRGFALFIYDCTIYTGNFIKNSSVVNFNEYIEKS